MKLIEVIGPEKYFFALMAPTLAVFAAMVLFEFVGWLAERIRK